MTSVFLNKRVAFVGQAPILEGKGLGAEIDAHDVVYRTNYLTSNSQDYGSRCDVISILEQHFKDTNAFGVPNLVLFRDIKSESNKYIVTPEERTRIVNWGINTFGHDIKDPTSGLVAYWLAMKFGAISFKFYGVTGYQNLNGEVVNHTEENHYTDESFSVLKDKDRALKSDMVNHPNHNFKAQNEIFRIMLKMGRIDMDPYSKQYFK